MKILKYKLSTFCKREEETIEHIFYDCDIVVAFWFDFEFYYRDMYEWSFKQKDMILGYNCNKSYININQNIICAKYYLYLMKLREEQPNFKVFFVIKMC